MTDPKKLVPSCTCPSDEQITELSETLDATTKRMLEEAGVTIATAPSSAEEPPQTPPEPSVDPQPVPPADPVAAFVEAIVAVDRRAFTSTAEIMAAARVWCAENDALPFGPRALAEQLKRRRGVQAHSNGQRRGWRGVKLR